MLASEGHNGATQSLLTLCGFRESIVASIARRALVVPLDD
jgi:hypothetical protein